MNVTSTPTATVSSLVGIRDVPEGVSSLITIVDPDYVDAFTVTTPAATNSSAEDWARAVLEQAPLSRHNARVLWRLMGLELGPRHSPDHVQGWKITGREDNWIRVETRSWYMTAQAICLVEPGKVSVSLSLRYGRRMAALIWGLVSGIHQRGVPVMLRQSVRLMTPSR